MVVQKVFILQLRYLKQASQYSKIENDMWKESLDFDEVHIKRVTLDKW